MGTAFCTLVVWLAGKAGFCSGGSTPHMTACMAHCALRAYWETGSIELQLPPGEQLAPDPQYGIQPCCVAKATPPLVRGKGHPTVFQGVPSLQAADRGGRASHSARLECTSLNCYMAGNSVCVRRL